MSKVEEIKSQLAQRLNKQAAQPKSSKSRAQSASQVTISPSNEEKIPEQNAHSQGAIKLSVSLYNSDIDRLDKIKDFMRKHGVRNLSDSEALRLACRAADVNGEFLGIYETMLKEDRRRKKVQSL